MKIRNVGQGGEHAYAVVRGWVGPYSAGGGITVITDGTTTVGGATTLEFDPAFFDVVDNGDGTVTITFIGTSGITVEDEGSPLATLADTLNFVGAGVVASGSGSTKTITIAGSPNAELNIEGGQDEIEPHGSMGSTETFDPTDGNVHSGTLTANCTFTLNAPTGTGFCSLELWLTEDGTGGWAVTWPGSVTEQGTHDTTLGTTQVVILQTIDGGTSWIATWVGSGIPASSFATPAIVLGTAAAAGTGSSVIRHNSTIVAFDATVPAAIGTAATGAATVTARRDHVHPTGAGTPTTSAIGDAAATGSGPAASMTNHVHGREALSVATPLVAAGSGATGTSVLSSRDDHVHPAGSATGADDHIHIVGEVQTGDGAATVFILAQEAIPATVATYNVAGARVAATLGGMNDTVTYAVQPGTGSFFIDYIPLQA